MNMTTDRIIELAENAQFSYDNDEAKEVRNEFFQTIESLREKVDVIEQYGDGEDFYRIFGNDSRDFRVCLENLFICARRMR